MANIGYAGLPVPPGGKSPTVPADIAAFAEAVDPHLRQFATDLADRVNRYATAPARTLVQADNGTLWFKLATNTDTWATLWEPQPVWDRTLSLSKNLQEGDVDLGLMVIGRKVELKGRIERVDGTNINDPNAVNLGAVPADCIPPGLRTWPGTCSMGGATTDAAGRLEVLGKNSASSYGVPGDVLWWYQGTEGTAWVDISGSYWLV